MEDRKVIVRSGGTSVFTATFIVLLTLKLTGYIDWSWWMVSAPLWAPILVFVSALAVAGIVWGFIVGTKALFRTRRKRKYDKLLREKMKAR